MERKVRFNSRGGKKVGRKKNRRTNNSSPRGRITGPKVGPPKK